MPSVFTVRAPPPTLNVPELALHCAEVSEEKSSSTPDAALVATVWVTIWFWAFVVVDSGSTNVERLVGLPNGSSVHASLRSLLGNASVFPLLSDPALSVVSRLRLS